jgi:hypothetical protein
MNRSQSRLFVAGVFAAGALLAACQVTSAPDGSESAPARTEPIDPAAIIAPSRVEQLREITPDEVTLVEIVEIDGSNDLRITGLTARFRPLSELIRAIEQSNLGDPRVETMGPADGETDRGQFVITVRSY